MCVCQVFVDRVSWLDRIGGVERPLLVNLAECGLIVTDENYADTLGLLPGGVRPRPLSAVVREALCDRRAGSPTVGSLADRLCAQISSRSFTAGLVRLIRHEHQRSGHKVGVVEIKETGLSFAFSALTLLVGRQEGHQGSRVLL